jgi:tetratricopeptide (TPR) repeat protein
MVKQLTRLLIAASLVVLAPFAADLGVSGSTVQAAENEAPKQKTRRVPSMSEATYKKLSEAQELADAKDLQGALRVLNEMLASRRRPLNGNEVGQVHNMMGFLYFSMEDYTKAIDNYRIVVNQGEDIPEGLEVTTLYTLAQLSFVAERYNDALRYMEQWIGKAENPGPDPHIFMGQVYYQMEDYRRSIQQIEKGIGIAQTRGTPVKENWWSLLNYLYYEQENWPKVLEILGILVRDFPKREYWIQLAGIHGQQGQEREQLAAMEAAYVGNYLREERDFTTLAGLLMQGELAIRAAKVLDKGIKDGVIKETSTNLRSLGQAWQLSQETIKAIGVFEQAGKVADDGKIYERLSQLYLDNDEFPKCVTAANNALNKGGLRKKQAVYVVRGMCEYNRDRLTSARASFVSCRNEARRLKDTGNQRVCQQWITFLDREVNRREQLAKAI